MRTCRCPTPALRQTHPPLDNRLHTAQGTTVLRSLAICVPAIVRRRQDQVEEVLGGANGSRNQAFNSSMESTCGSRSKSGTRKSVSEATRGAVSGPGRIEASDSSQWMTSNRPTATVTAVVAATPRQCTHSKSLKSSRGSSTQGLGFPVRKVILETSEQNPGDAPIYTCTHLFQQFSIWDFSVLTGLVGTGSKGLVSVA